MRQYLNLCKTIINIGSVKENRTGVNHVGYHADMCQYNLSEGFPAVTTKKLAFNSVVAEMLGFLRGYDNAADFRALGCNVWNANANENEAWLKNPHRKGQDDLGRIYGVQARDWGGKDVFGAHVDQLKIVVEKLNKGIDDRRLIVNHWNPGEFTQMALPPCHVMYMFGIEYDIRGPRLDMGMVQRSCDVPLGVPFNIAGYAWLLSVIAHITGFRPGVFTHFLWDIHAYVNQLELMEEQLKRDPHPLPTLYINPDIRSLEDLETWVMPSDFELENYQHHPAINYPFSV